MPLMNSRLCVTHIVWSGLLVVAKTIYALVGYGTVVVCLVTSYFYECIISANKYSGVLCKISCIQFQ
jgi:hypothetical protein